LTGRISTMGKEKKDKIKDSTPCLNSTTKFAVLDYPGETQATVDPRISDIPVSNDAASPAGGSGGAQGRRATAGSGPKISKGLRLGGNSFVGRQKDPSWLSQRVAVYDAIKQRRSAELALKKPVNITVAMPDGNVIQSDKEGNPLQAWITNPYDVAVTISAGLADSATVARVTYSSFVDDYSTHEDGMDGVDTMSEAMADGEIESDNSEKSVLWDMTRPLVGSVAKLELLKFESDQAAKTVFWHSSAHMMGEALEHLFGNKLTIGPPLAGGFYYDSYMGRDTLKEDDCESAACRYCSIHHVCFRFYTNMHISSFRCSCGSARS
jgi:threonyl-tRNA synthetase